MVVASVFVFFSADALSVDNEDDGDEGVICWLNWHPYLCVFLLLNVLFLWFSLLSLYCLLPASSLFFPLFFSPPSLSLLAEEAYIA